jgi:hypothetical protein
MSYVPDDINAVTSTRKELEDKMIAETEDLRQDQRLLEVRVQNLEGEYYSLALLLRSGRNLAIGALVLTVVNTCLGIAGLIR